MKPSIEEIILTPILERYFSDDPNILQGIETRERIGTLGNMQIMIYSNDHNPPHFHVKSRDRTIDAKFKIENGEYLSGTIDTKGIKRINAFFNDIKVKSRMEAIWNKKIN
ncbi:DUF4160 domain-containing protein [Flavobacterium ponti]|uniref:DUF4160 domain-containing protein n=1 Tax=Flavobacterium ponti TaxID=665133 RepID=A0ABV9P407_9FLAO